MKKLAVFLCASGLSLLAPGLAAGEPTPEDLATKGILIGTLVKDGKVKRAAAKSVRGSVYSAA